MGSKGVATQQAKLNKALTVIDNALEHLSTISNIECLECVHIDILISKIIDLPTESKQKNSRRNLTIIKNWMLSDGAGVALLFYDGQVYWRLGDLNEAQFRELKETLYRRASYREILRNPLAAKLVLQRIKVIQESKLRICDELAKEIKASEKCRADLPPDSFDHGAAANTHGLLTPQSEDWSDASFAEEENLWRNENEQRLIEFYKEELCPTRTVANPSANTYLKIMEFAKYNESTRLAIMSLSASYMKHRQKSASKNYHEADHYYMSAALKALMQEITNCESSTEACLGTAMVLVHHAICNEAELGASWLCHLKVLDILPDRNAFTRSDAAVFMSHQRIVAETVQPGVSVSLNMDCIHWLLHGSEDEVTQISSTAGLSRQVLFAVATITSMTNIPNRGLALELQDLLLTGKNQWTGDCPVDALQVVLDTAETYRISTLIYLQCRIFGLTQSHPMIVQQVETLYPILMRLPTTGPFYTAAYPIWPLFICSLVANGVSRDSLFQCLLSLKSFEIRTTKGLCNAVSRAHNWMGYQTNTPKRNDWWEEMIAFADFPGTAFCLG